ncbi:broad-specificity phosphatase YOR283W [Trichomonascus vanleenenianus]|uniref:phosphoglycerate mutase n=1 Tax=Trichomonascus vanleenenianus TaxID=2268995 RepID=UPI003ECB90DB
MKDTLKIIIVRHGQTEFNKLKVLQGHTDTSLNDQGIHEARLAGGRLMEENTKLNAVWSSDLKRCRQTTKHILEASNQSNLAVVYSEDLRERCMGELEGMSVREARAKCEAEGTGFHDYGEPRKAAVKRLNRAFDAVVENSLAAGYDTVMIVSHGGVVSKFISHLVRDQGFVFGPDVRDEDIKVPHNTSFTIVQVDRDTKKGVVEAFGDARHTKSSVVHGADER